MPTIRFVPLEKVLELRENGADFSLVDVLAPEVYREGHLPGAINLPLADLEKLLPEQRFSQDRTIVVYCASYQCSASTMAAKKLLELGYAEVFDYKGGKKDWSMRGLPLVTD